VYGFSVAFASRSAFDWVKRPKRGPWAYPFMHATCFKHDLRRGGWVCRLCSSRTQLVEGTLMSCMVVFSLTGLRRGGCVCRCLFEWICVSSAPCIFFVWLCPYRWLEDEVRRVGTGCCRIQSFASTKCRGRIEARPLLFALCQLKYCCVQTRWVVLSCSRCVTISSRSEHSQSLSGEVGGLSLLVVWQFSGGAKCHCQRRPSTDLLP